MRTPPPFNEAAHAYALSLAGLIREDASAGHGGTVWDSAPVLCGLLPAVLPTVRPPGERPSTRVLELGAGSGLCGLVAARMGASVLLTDKPAYLPLLTANAGWGVEAGCAVTAAPFTFGSNVAKGLALHPGGPPFDVVLLSDVLSALGDAGGFHPLIKTLVDVCGQPRAAPLPPRPTLVLLAGKVRAGFEARFLPALEDAGFAVEEVARLHGWRPPPSLAPQPSAPDDVCPVRPRAPLPSPPPGHYLCREACEDDVVVHAAWLLPATTTTA